MTFRQFEREFLRLAFTTTVDLTPACLAFYLDCPIAEAERHMQRLVDLGVLELTSDDDGRLGYSMPDRKISPLIPEAVGYRAGALVPFQPLHPAPLTSSQAVLSLFLNALVCPGVGTLVGGRTAPGMAQLSLFLLGLPLVVFTVGVPLMIAAWLWSVASGVKMVAEARD